MSLLPEVRHPEFPPSSASDSLPASAGIQGLQVRTGADQLGISTSTGPGILTLDLPMPHLGGPETEWIGESSGGRKSGGFHLLERPDGCYGIALGEPGEPPQAAAHRLYTALLRETAGRHLHRVWNWVPGINDTVGGEENYRAFNAGRHAAFAGHFGAEGLRPHLPAASALGIRGDRMAVLFAAGDDVPENFENPEQVPACEYPPQYGRLPPTFARGTRVAYRDGGREWFLSGTASIKGHETLGGSFDTQMRLTLDNVRLMRRHMGVPDGAAARWKVFLRHPRDLAACEKAFTAAYPQDQATTIYLHADICRASLLVEVEGTFSSPPVR